MAESKKGHFFARQGPTEKKIRVRLFFVLMLHIKISRFYSNWFPKYSRHLIFTKRGITLAIFNALRLKLISTSSYGKDIVYQISTPYLKRFLRYRVRKKDIMSTRFSSCYNGRVEKGA